MLINDRHDLEKAVYGGALFGGGGGGKISVGLEFGKFAIEAGRVEIVNIDNLPEDAYVLVTSSVGAGGTRKARIQPDDHVRAVELLMKNFPPPIAGLMTCELGAMAIVYGWYQSARLGIPVIDAAGDGRAHPTGLMGAMGLHLIQDYESIQVAVGGDKTERRNIEIISRGSLLQTAEMTIKASICAGGSVAVARDPVSVRFVKEHGVVGALSKTIPLGGKYLEARTGGFPEIKKFIQERLDGIFVLEGEVSAYNLSEKKGFGVGHMVVKASNQELELTVMNEFMTLESDGHRIATFPDLIIAIDCGRMVPLNCSEIGVGNKVGIFYIPRSKIGLGDGLKDKDLFLQLEEAIEKSIVEYIF